MFLLAAALGAVGQWLYKAGSDKANDSFAGYINLPIISGIICYSAVMVLFVAAFKRGGQPQVLYPIYSSTFIFAAFIAWFYLGQPIKPAHMVGMLCLFAGMFLMGR